MGELGFAIGNWEMRDSIPPAGPISRQNGTGSCPLPSRRPPCFFVPAMEGAARARAAGEGGRVCVCACVCVCKIIVLFLLPASCCVLCVACCCLLPAACCLLCAVCCVLPAVCCLLSDVRCLLPAVCCVLCPACCDSQGNILTRQSNKEFLVGLVLVLCWSWASGLAATFFKAVGPAMINGTKANWFCCWVD